MNNIHALVVGIEKYDQPGWNVTGPCKSALDMVAWLISVKVPPENIQLFLDTMDKEELDKVVSKLDQGIRLVRTAEWSAIDTYCRDRLRNVPPDSRLFVYWSGHGFTENDGTRIFICRDYTADALNNRVFNGSNFLRHLRSSNYQCFTEQIFLADVCGVFTGLKFAADKTVPENQVPTTRQIAYFATPEGEVAKGGVDGGVFTKIALEALNRTTSWPDYAAFPESLDEAMSQHGQTPFRIYGFTDKAELQERLVGILPKGNDLFNSVFGNLLSTINLPDSIFRPHYFRTTSDLGMPALNKAQGLTGMIQQLTAMWDSTGEGNAPYGLAQFLSRLARETRLSPNQRERIHDWLSTNVKPQQLANINQKLDEEDRKKFLIIEVTNDGNGKISGFQPFLRKQDLSPVTGAKSDFQAVRSWEELQAKIQALIARLQEDNSTSEFEIHFLADPPLFDRPFHQIPSKPGGGPLGEEFVIVLRHRSRVRSSMADLRTPWQRCADALRSQSPAKLSIIQVGFSATGPDGWLPSVKGICYANFVLTTGFPESANDKEKQTLLRLMRLGAPYVYWLHAPKPRMLEKTDHDKIEYNLKQWLSSRANLDEFPVEFFEQRLNLNVFASDATLLWDDPQFIPFLTTEGATQV